MPKFLENLLQQAAAAKGLTGRAADRYTYGALNDMGAMKGNQITPKGAAMQAKHTRDVAAGRASNPTPPAAMSNSMRTGNGSHPGRNLGKFLHPPKRSR